MLKLKIFNLSPLTHIIHNQAGTMMVYPNSSRLEMTRARPDGASICDGKPLAMAGLDMREMLIYFMQISLDHFTT